MKKTLKEIIKATPENSHFYLLDSNLTYPQPDPETSENFITDYKANADNYNLYALLKRGNQCIEIDEDLYDMMGVNNIAAYTMALSESITDTYLNAWARLYYALSLAYNPIYNVDGVTIKTTSERERTDAYGAQSGGATIGAISTSDVHGAQSGSTIYGAVSESDVHGAQSKSDVWGAKSSTLGEHTDTQTNYSVSFDATTEKETGKTSNVMGAQTNTEATYTDGHTSQSYTDSHTEQQRTDQTSSQSYTDSHTEQARSDTHQEAAHSDKHTDAEFTETEERKGNIGVTMTQQMLNAEWELRKKDFFSTIINQMLDELGFMYIGGIEA